MKRLPAAVWILLPLLLGLLYALVSPILAPALEHASMAPPGAVLVERFKDLDTFDRDYYFPLGPGAPSHSAILGVENNVKGLPGVDRSRPLVLVKMPPSAIGTDPSLVLFPLRDAELFERAFLDPEMLEKGLIRRAKHLVIHGRGAWAAVAARRPAARQVGTGSLHAALRGEDFSIAAYLPGLAATAVQNQGTAPWRGILAALVDGDGTSSPIELKRDRETGEVIPVFTKAPRLARVLETWRVARLWSWRDERRIEIELEPTAPDGLPWLRRVLDETADDDALPAPPSLEQVRMWVRVPNRAARLALLALVHSLGVEVPAGLREADQPGGLLAVATRAAGHPYAASFAVATPRRTALDLTPLLGAVPDPGGRVERPRGTLPLTVIDTRSERPSPPGFVVRETAGPLDIVGVGVSAPTAVTRIRALLEQPAPRPRAPLVREGWHLIAAFAADQGRLDKLLGTTVGERGLFGALQGGPAQGEIRTDGRRVRLTVTGIP